MTLVDLPALKALLDAPQIAAAGVILPNDEALRRLVELWNFAPALIAEIEGLRATRLTWVDANIGLSNENAALRERIAVLEGALAVFENTGSWYEQDNGKGGYFYEWAGHSPPTELARAALTPAQEGGT